MGFDLLGAMDILCTISVRIRWRLVDRLPCWSTGTLEGFFVLYVYNVIGFHRDSREIEERNKNNILFDIFCILWSSLW